jgi:hypothetical protein
MFISAIQLIVSVALSAPTSLAGCSKDTDCKGTRICENGACTEPPNSTAEKSIRPKKASLKHQPISPSKDDMVFLSIDSNEPNAILMRVGTTKEGVQVSSSFLKSEITQASSSESTQACAPPCNKWLSRHEEYFVKNVSLPQGRSEPLVLPDVERVTLKIDSYSSTARRWGVVTGVLGLSMSLTGLLFWKLGPANSEPENIGKKTFFVGAPLTLLGVILKSANTAEIQFVPSHSHAD